MATSTAPNVISPLSSWEKVPALKSARKKSNPLLFVGMAAVVLLGASGLWRVTHTAPATPMVKVVAAVRDIPAGTKLGFYSVHYLDVPRKFASPDMIVSLNDINGRVARTFLQGGEPIQADMLFSGRDGLSMNLETHERAITLQLNDDTTVDHAIRPDDVVDVLAISTKEGKKYTKTIGQAVRVVMAASKEQMLSRAVGSVSNLITLAVTPDLAEAITEATETGKVRLVLRNRLSRVQEHLAGVKPDDILPADAQAQALAMPARPQTAPLLAPPPPPAQEEYASATLSPAQAFPGADSSPLGWIVQVFAGNHKESVSVPAE